MRLLNTTTLQFKEFYDIDTPPYAILSHRWSGYEVSHSDFVADQKKDTAGYVKIVEACNLAADYYDYDWIWVDTCCINKDSSTEVSEAINSMYQWYRNAELCLAYLRDVSSKPEESTGPHYEAFLREFRNSEWFTRGWTLQELLAPPEIVFVSNQWQPIGTRNGFATLISDITNIDYHAILHQTSLEKWSVASRMSWASRRRTSRVEDEAYCLLGLFGINMPLLYGEGRRAFKRLQEEIVRVEDDESIFAWEADRGPHILDNGNLFAPSTSRFAYCGNVFKALYDERQPYSMTNGGLQIDVVLFPLGDDSYLIPLNCGNRNREGSEAPLALKVYKTGEKKKVFRRWGCIAMRDAGYESLMHSMATHNRTVVFMQTNASESNMIAQMTEMGRRAARSNEKRKECDHLVRLIDKGLRQWTEIEPRDLHVLCDTNDGYAKAEQICMKALQECEKAWGVEHTSTLSMVYKLGHFYAYEGKIVEATEMYTRALLGYEKSKERDHPSTKTITRKIQSLQAPKREKPLKELYWWKIY